MLLSANILLQGSYIGVMDTRLPLTTKKANLLIDINHTPQCTCTVNCEHYYICMPEA